MTFQLAWEGYEKSQMGRTKGITCAETLDENKI